MQMFWYTKHFKWGDLWKWYKQSPISTWTKQVSRSTWCRIFKTDSNIWRFKTSMYELIFFVSVKHMKLKWISWTCDVHRNLWILAKIVCELHCHIILFWFFLSQQLGNNLFKFWPTLLRSINCCVSGERCRLQGSCSTNYTAWTLRIEECFDFLTFSFICCYKSWFWYFSKCKRISPRDMSPTIIMVKLYLTPQLGTAHHSDFRQEESDLW